MLENENKIKNEEETKNELQVSETELDEAIDEKLLSMPLNAEERKLINSIIEAPSKDELQKQFDLFNMNQSKKNALRIIKLNNLLSKVEDQAIERFEKRPDQVSNKELLEYMTVVSGQIDRAQKSVDSLDMNPAIHVANQKNEVNINVGGELDRDSKENVMNAIGELLKQVKKNMNNEEDDSIEAEVIEPEDEEEPIKDPNIIETDENKLYNNKDIEEDIKEDSESVILNDMDNKTENFNETLLNTED